MILFWPSHVYNNGRTWETWHFYLLTINKWKERGEYVCTISPSGIKGVGLPPSNNFLYLLSLIVRKLDLKEPQHNWRVWIKDTTLTCEQRNPQMTLWTRCEGSASDIIRIGISVRVQLLHYLECHKEPGYWFESRRGSPVISVIVTLIKLMYGTCFSPFCFCCLCSPSLSAHSFVQWLSAKIKANKQTEELEMDRTYIGIIDHSNCFIIEATSAYS